jgi:hypothetical protein
MENIPVIICIDAEPDDRAIKHGEANDWKGFEETLRYFHDLRTRFAEGTGAPVRFTWFFRMDPQIEHVYGDPRWVAQRYGGEIRELVAAGDDLGLHTHAWRWDAERKRWLTDNGNQEWINHCIHTSFEAFQNAFRRPCLSFRFGDHWMNNETIDLLESLGVEFEMTPEPGRKAALGLMPNEMYTGSLPDYSTTPTSPFKPARHDFREADHTGARNLWVIPLSTDTAVGRFVRLKQTAKALGIDLYEADQLNLSHHHAQFRNMMDSLLNVRLKSYLAPAIKTDALIYPPARAHLERNVEFLLSHPSLRHFRFVTPAEAIDILN